MSIAQRFFERCVKLFRLDRLTLLQIERHQFFIDFHNLIYQRAVCCGDRRKIRVSSRIEKTVGDGCAIVCGKIDRQTFLAEGFLNFHHQRGQIDIDVVDLVHHHHRTEVAFTYQRHHSARGKLDTVLRIDDDYHRVNCIKRRDRRAHEIRITGGIDQMNAYIGILTVGKMYHRRIERMFVGFFDGVEITNG